MGDDDVILGALAPIGADRALGRYELIVPVGRGGMAVVWAARQRGSRGFSKIVALKVMLPHQNAHERFERMFLNEANIASKIRHPNVCSVEDVGEKDGVLYIVMEWIDGDPVSSLPDDLPVEAALHIVREAACGLHAAHVAEVVHRDVSPQNILVTADGLVKIVDFGIAKALIGADVTTASGVIKGKAAYLAPEQVNGAEVDARTDVFALGIVLYELLSGTHPFRAASDLPTLLAIASTDPAPPLSLGEDVAHREELARIVARALAKDPEERYASMADLAADLDAVIERLDASVVRARARELFAATLGPRRAARAERLARAERRNARPSEVRPDRKRAPLYAGALVIAAMGVFGVATSLRGRPAPEEPRREAPSVASSAVASVPPVASASETASVIAPIAPPSITAAAPARATKPRLSTTATTSAAPAPPPPPASAPAVSSGAPFRDPGF